MIGHEWIKGITDKQVFNTTAVSAPIGIAVSWRVPYNARAKSKDKSQGSSISLFASLIDLGAVTSYRFSTTDSVEKLPTIQLKDIIAPGFLFMGFKRLAHFIKCRLPARSVAQRCNSDVNTTVNNHYSV